MVLGFKMDLQQELTKTIQSVQDFPKEGVVFRDINPLFKQPALMKKIIAEMADLLNK